MKAAKVPSVRDPSTTRQPPYRNTADAPSDRMRPGQAAGEVAHPLHPHQRVDEQVVEFAEAAGLTRLGVGGNHERVCLQRFDQEAAKVRALLPHRRDLRLEPAPVEDQGARG